MHEFSQNAYVTVTTVVEYYDGEAMATYSTRLCDWSTFLNISFKTLLVILVSCTSYSHQLNSSDQVLQSLYRRGVLLNAAIERRINVLSMAHPWAKKEFERLNALDLTERNRIINELIQKPNGAVLAQALAAGVSPDTVKALRNRQSPQESLPQKNKYDMRSFDDEQFSLDPRLHKLMTFNFDILFQPPWLTTTWHPILKPNALSVLANPEISFLNRGSSRKSLYRLDAIYYAHLAKYAELSAADLTEKFTSEMAAVPSHTSPLRIQMENAVIYATYVMPISFLLSNVPESNALRKSAQYYLTEQHREDLLDFTTAIWNDEASANLRDTVIRHPLEVFTILIHQAFTAERLALPAGLQNSSDAAETVLREGDVGAPHVVRNLLYPLLKAISAPAVRAQYPFPWYPDGYLSETLQKPLKRSNHFTGLSWLKGYNNLIAELGGYLEAKQRTEGTFATRLSNMPWLEGNRGCQLLFEARRTQ